MASVGAKTLWVRNVWKKFLESETGFDYVLMKHLKVTDATDGKVSAEMPVEPQHLNRLNSMHGGMIATLVDIGGSLAIAAKGMNSTGLSTDISISYIDAAKAGDVLLLKSECLKIGKTLAFTTIDLYNKKDSKLISQGRHTKFLKIAHRDPLNEFKIAEKKQRLPGRSDGEGTS